MFERFLNKPLNNKVTWVQLIEIQKPSYRNIITNFSSWSKKKNRIKCVLSENENWSHKTENFFPKKTSMSFNYFVISYIKYIKHLIRKNNGRVSIRFHVWAFSSKYCMFPHIYGVPVVFHNSFTFIPSSYLKCSQTDQINNKWKNINITNNKKVWLQQRIHRSTKKARNLFQTS